MKAIINDSNRMKEADILFTEALKLLEEYKYNLCLSKCDEANKISFNIEQRLAISFIQVLAIKKDKELIKKYLIIAYDYK